MLTEYSKYLESIRDSLVQCGVAFPTLESISSLDYQQIFNIGEELDSLMYFYNIMVCSGNMEEIFLPSDQNYKNHIRIESFKEFSEDILPKLKSQYGDTSENSLDIDCTDVVEEEEPTEWVNDNVPVEDVLIEESDIFGIDDNTTEPIEEVINTDLRSDFVDFCNSISDGNLLPDPKEDFFAEEPAIVEDDILSEEVEEIEFVPHGTDILSLQFESNSSESQDNWVSEDVTSEESNFSSITWDDEPEELDENLDWEEDEESDEPEELEENLDWEEDELEELDENLDWVEDEDELEELDENLDWSEDEEIEENLDWSEDEEPEEIVDWSEDEDDVEDNSSPDLDDDIGSIDWSEDEDKEEVFESPKNSTSYEYGVGNYGEPDTSNSINSFKNMDSYSSYDMSGDRVFSEDRDIVDSVQELASNALTGVKRAVSRLYKLKE